MLKLFSLWAMTTKLTMILDYKADIRTPTGFNGRSTRWEVSFNDEATSTEIYKLMKDHCKMNAGELLLESSVSISLTGKIKSVKINESFSDLESYRDYLEANSLLSQPMHLSDKLNRK